MNYTEDAGHAHKPSLIEATLEAVRHADREGRAKLPALPPGYEWHSEIELAEAGSAAMTAKLVYRVRPVPGILSPRRARE